MSQRRFHLREHAGELDTYLITGILKDETATPVPAQTLNTLRLTLFNDADGSIINGVSAQDILNIDRGTVDMAGNFACLLTPNDNVILGTELEELHVAFFDWTYAGGVKRGSQEVEFLVHNFVKSQ